MTVLFKGGIDRLLRGTTSSVHTCIYISHISYINNVTKSSKDLEIKFNRGTHQKKIEHCICNLQKETKSNETKNNKILKNSKWTVALVHEKRCEKGFGYSNRN